MSCWTPPQPVPARLTEEVRADRIERVRPQFVVALHDLQDVELKAAIHVRLLRVASSVSLGREVRLLDLGLDACRAQGKKS